MESHEQRNIGAKNSIGGVARSGVFRGVVLIPRGLPVAEDQIDMGRAPHKNTRLFCKRED
jgi:hypothetical protein